MGRGIEMQRIKNVFLTSDRIIRRLIDVLRPSLRADNNQIVRVNGADSSYHRLGIRLDRAVPIRRIQRLIINFINDVGRLAVALGDMGEERLALQQHPVRLGGCANRR